MSAAQPKAPRSLQRAPVWMPCALVAVVGWLVGAHQVGPLSVYAEAAHLSVAWYALEQALAVAVTVAALGAGAALFAGVLPPLRVVVEGVCQARWPLALAAALASRAALSSFMPERILDVGGDGLKMGLGPLQWAWLIVVTLAVAGLMLRAAWRYALVLQLVVPSGWRLIGALLVALLSGEVVGRLLTGWAFRLLVWPP